MRAMVLFLASVAVLWGGIAWSRPAPPDEKKDAKKDDKSAAKGESTPAAERTRAKSLKVKLSLSFKGARLGDVLKECAAQVDMKADLQLMWTYGTDFPFDKKINYACKDKSLEAVLDELFKQNGGLGYIVISKDGDKHDGWVLLTTTGERGIEKNPK